MSDVGDQIYQFIITSLPPDNSKTQAYLKMLDEEISDMFLLKEVENTTSMNKTVRK